MASSKNDNGSYIFCYIGSFLFIGGALFGAVCAMPDLQIATSMRDKPDTMSLSTFIDQGPKDNAFIRLTNVEVDLENSYEIISTRTSRRGFRTSQSSGIIANLYPINLERSSPVVAMRAPESYEEAWEKAVEQGIVEGRILPKMIGDAFDGMKRHINTHNSDSVRWTIEPLKHRPVLKQARLNVLYALLIGALGLAIANLGESTAGTLTSFISYLGAPLRVRPFSTFWPGLYIVVGLALIGSSYETIFDYGKLGSIYFNGLMLSLGYVLAQLGLGAIFSAILVPGLYYLFDESSSNKSKSSTWILEEGMTPPALPVPAQRLPYCPTEFGSLQYQDPLVTAVDTVPAVTAGIIPENDMLPADILGDKLQPFQVHDQSGTAFSQLYLGCSNLVLTEQVVREGVSEVRLCSLLGDGLMLVTTHHGNTLTEQTRQGTTAAVHIVESNEKSNLIVKLFDAHLAKCDKLKSARGTHVENLQQDDAQCVWLYMRRAVAEMRFQYGLAEFEVQPMDFGRFRYPTGPKAQVAPSDVSPVSPSLPPPIPLASASQNDS